MILDLKADCHRFKSDAFLLRHHIFCEVHVSHTSTQDAPLIYHMLGE